MKEIRKCPDFLEDEKSSNDTKRKIKKKFDNCLNEIKKEIWQECTTIGNIEQQEEKMLSIRK